MTKVKKLKMSREQRSIINRKNAMRSVELRKMAGGFTWRGKSHSGVPGMPLKHCAMYTTDYIIYHRYAMKMKMTKLDLLHELIAPLKAKLDGHEPDPWVKVVEETTLPREEY